MQLYPIIHPAGSPGAFTRCQTIVLLIKQTDEGFALFEIALPRAELDPLSAHY